MRLQISFRLFNVRKLNMERAERLKGTSAAVLVIMRVESRFSYRKVMTLNFFPSIFYFEKRSLSIYVKWTVFIKRFPTQSYIHTFIQLSTFSVTHHSHTVGTGVKNQYLAQGHTGRRSWDQTTNLWTMFSALAPICSYENITPR